MPSLRRSDDASAKPALGARERERLLEQLRECAEGLGGEVSARSRAARLGHSYLQLADAGRHEFLRLLALEFGPDPVRVKVDPVFRTAV